MISDALNDPPCLLRRPLPVAKRRDELVNPIRAQVGGDEPGTTSNWFDFAITRGGLVDDATPSHPSVSSDVPPVGYFEVAHHDHRRRARAKAVPRRRWPCSRSRWQTCASPSHVSTWMLSAS
jgi:hypothetical protein